VKWLARHAGADALVLTEVANAPGGHALMEALAAHGFDVLVPTAAPGAYGVVLAARGGLTPVTGINHGALPHRCAAAVATVGSRQVGIIGVYVPSRGPQPRRNQDKRAFQEALLDRLPHLLSGVGDLPTVLAGDLNVVEPRHIPHLPVFGTWEYAFYEHLAGGAGLADAFRALHPRAVDHSWYGRSGAGYRLDHIFVRREQVGRLRSCGYLHAPRLASLSDHAAMSVTLDLTP
jgi:exonuclease III